MENISKLKSLTEKNLLPCSCSWEKSLISNVIDILDRNDLFLDLVKVIDKGTVTCRTEKKRISLSSERSVLHIHSHSVSSLVLESESDIVLHTVLLLVLSLHLSISLLEKMLMLWRDSHNEVCCAILILHIVLSLHKMLSKCSADLAVCVLMELKHSLRLSAIAKSLISKSLRKNLLTILRALACLLTEKLWSVESELLDLVNKLSCWSIICQLLACLQCIKTAEKVLEHT